MAIYIYTSIICNIMCIYIIWIYTYFLMKKIININIFKEGRD